MYKIMRKSAFTLLLLTLCSALSLAQDGVPYGQNLRALLNDKMAENYNENGEQSVYSSDFSKNPFIFKEWKYAKITFSDGKVVDSLLLNYDDKQSVLLVTMAQSINPFTLKTNDVKEFTFYNNPARPYIGKGRGAFEEVSRSYAFYEKLYGNDDDSGVTILKTFIKRFRDAEDSIEYGSMTVASDKFDLFTRYYIKEGANKYKRLSLGKKAIQKRIGKDKMKEAQKLLKSKKLKWGDEEAIVVVLEAFQ